MYGVHQIGQSGLLVFQAMSCWDVVENGKPVVYRNGENLDEPYINKYPLIRSWKHDLDDYL